MGPDIKRGDELTGEKILDLLDAVWVLKWVAVIHC
jgi:hypothetical protein